MAFSSPTHANAYGAHTGILQIVLKRLQSLAWGQKCHNENIFNANLVTIQEKIKFVNHT